MSETTTLLPFCRHGDVPGCAACLRDSMDLVGPACRQCGRGTWLDVHGASVLVCDECAAGWYHVAGGADVRWRDPAPTTNARRLVHLGGAEALDRLLSATANSFVEAGDATRRAVGVEPWTLERDPDRPDRLRLTRSDSAPELVEVGRCPVQPAPMSAEAIAIVGAAVGLLTVLVPLMLYLHGRLAGWPASWARYAATWATWATG